MIKQPALAKYDYGIVHYNSYDARGIDVALIYQKKRFSVINTYKKEIKLFNRRDEFFDKALAFAQRVNENTDCVVTVTDLADQQAFAEALASADILTNGTKVGMKPLENESLVNDISLLHPGLLVTECVYNPHMTKLLQQAQQAGCKTIDGYGMLLWQGAEQFTLWTGKDFPLEYVKQVMGFGA